MTLPGVLGILVFVAVMTALAKPVGSYLYAVYDRRQTWFDPVLRPVERTIYRWTGVREEQEMRWTEYFLALLAFNFSASACQSLEGKRI